MAGTEEAVLIARARQGDGQAFDLLYETHRTKVRNLISGRVRDPDDRDDLVQMTFVRACNALPRFRGNALFSTWLHRIALNLCKSHLKSAWSRKVRLDEMEDPEGFLGGVEIAQDVPRPDQVLISQGIEAIVRAEIEALPERYRLATRLRFVKELSYQELARELHLPMGTVKVRLHRGRQHLRERLAWLGNWS
jgi:RNA polymerase sigma-70 factor (ECF subfamily)